MLFVLRDCVVCLSLVSTLTGGQSTDSCNGNDCYSATIDYLLKKLQEHELQLNALRSLCSSTDKPIPSPAVGVSYIRWGRTACDNNASVIYTGYAAGPHYNQPGSGANLLCLHQDPQWNYNQTASGSFFGTLYGLKYEIGGWLGNGGMFSLANNGGTELLDNPGPCVACYASGKSEQIMIPARRECPSGWSKEYEGYLVSEMNIDASSK